VILSNKKLYFDFAAIFRYAETGVERSAGSDEQMGMQLALFSRRREATSSRDGEGCGITASDSSWMKQIWRDIP
jgi:hypothetical protein